MSELSLSDQKGVSSWMTRIPEVILAVHNGRTVEVEPKRAPAYLIKVLACLGNGTVFSRRSPPYPSPPSLCPTNPPAPSSPNKSTARLLY